MPIDLALTSIPVLAPASTTASTSPDEAREDQSQEMPPSSSQASGNGESGRANDTSFIQSQKTVNARATLLWELARYSSKSAGDFYWSLSAMGSGGFQSVTDEQRALRVWNLEDDLYDHWTLGARLTLYQKRDKDWFPAAYMMYGRGSFQNFEYPLEDEDSEVINCLSDPVMCHSPPPKKAFKLGRSGGRNYFELRILMASIYIGVNINNGEGRDDMRLMVGASVGLDRVVGLFGASGS